ncbi:hypothetical protein [Paenibacillus polysaccharolyticus]|uniref:hypothetical protein n=1 Tax=Paenibacillus polysaccharolyticus TaxID=582692 RepID=UPI00203D9DFD|nr:hypothetical protein [Paenibacillus polysaccharolyticus]
MPEYINPAALSRYVATLISGMLIQAVIGAGREDLEDMINIALSALSPSHN